MTDVFRTIVVHAEQQQAAQEIAPGCFTTALSADGLPPATHYIASGYLPLEQVDAIALLEGADVSEEEPFDVMDRLVLQMLQEPISQL